jgi:hypothetical protein
MLLDIVQITYLQISNSSNVSHPELFYKGVIFLDSLRGDFLATQKVPSPSESRKAMVPESMRRWLCRLLYQIPHDPLNRKRHAETLNKAYLEIDIFKYGVPIKIALIKLLIYI